MSVTWILKIYCNLIRTGEAENDWEEYFKFQDIYISLVLMSKTHQQIKVLRTSFVLYEMFQKFRYLLLFKRSLPIFFINEE